MSPVNEPGATLFPSGAKGLAITVTQAFVFRSVITVQLRLGDVSQMHELL